jgi:hypothetical protein
MRSAVTLTRSELGADVVSRVWSAMLGSRFWSRSKNWAECVVILDGEGPLRIVHRREFHAELLGNDLPSLAHEVIARRVPAGCVLVYVALDSAVSFVLVRLAQP